MPRHLATLLSAPAYALDMRVGRSWLSAIAQKVSADGTPAYVLPEGASAESWEQHFVRRYGHLHYFVNPDGTQVHSLDDDAMERLQVGAVAIVPVKGVLVKEADLFEEAWFGITSNHRLERLFQSLRSNDRVAAAVQTIFSPGGQVWGTEEYGNAARAFDAEKPLISHINPLAGSAAYWGAVTGRKVVLNSRTSEAGSIGVMTAWLDMIPWLEKEGLKWREYYAPESGHKNEEWRAIREKDNGTLLEESMSPTAQLFIEHVRICRGDKLDKRDKAVLAGRVYQGQAAIDAGLADAFGSLDDATALARSEANVPTATTANNPNTMTNVKKLVAIAAALFSGKTEVSDDEIKEANTSLKEQELSNVRYISDAEATRLENAAQSIADAERKTSAAEDRARTAESALADAKSKADADKALAEGQVSTLTSERDQAKQASSDLNTKLASIAKEAGIEVAEGADVCTAISDKLAAAKKEVADLTARVNELGEQEASDGKPLRAPKNGTDATPNANAEELTEDEKAFRNTPLG